MSSTSPPLVWLITGCSSGFGEALTLLALQAGHKVIATSRTPSKTPELVEQVKSLGGIWLTLDVSKRETDPIIKEALRIYGRIDVLVNNAGFSLIGPFEDWTDDEAQAQFETNFFGPFRLVRAVLPYMRAQGSGTIVNVSSAGAVDPQAGMGMYAASKCALEGFSQSLAKEVSSFGIRIIIAIPGRFTTNMMNAIAPIRAGVTEPYKDTGIAHFMNIFMSDQDINFPVAGNVDKGAQAIFEAVTKQGRGEGKEHILSLPLSADVAERFRGKIKDLQLAHDTYKDVWEYTAHDGGKLLSQPRKN